MPRRKRTSDEGGRRAKVSRVEHNEEPVVISDSEHDEEDENKRSSRTARWKRRENKSNLQDMTEEELLALAMSLSAQEANTAAHRQQLEDNDIQKAIEESLNESTVKASEGQEDEAGSSSDQPQENVGNPTSNLRRKLSYSSQDQTHSENERETTSPLPEMPDLSQTTSSHLSSRSSFQISGPPAATEDKTSDKQTVISDTPEEELFKSQSSLVFSSHSSLILQPVVCVEKLSQDLISVSGGLNVHTQDSAVTPTCADRSQFSEQEDSPFSKCPAFTQRDFKRGIDLLEDKGDPKNANGNEDETQTPDEDTDLPTKLSQDLSTDTDTCLSLSRTSQLSPKCVPEDKDDDVTVTSKTPDVKQAEDQSTQDEKAKSDTENAPNTQSWNEFASHMVVHLADDDEDDGSEEVLSPSPVPIKEEIFRPIKTDLSPTQSRVSSSAVTLDPSTQDARLSRSVLEQDSRASKGTESKPSDRKHPHTPEDKGERAISYYWGVPFCPVGQNPDEYTRVIMCQMEVYEKTLKEAQRKLLRKADWGQPVFPGSSERSFGARRWKRHRAPQLSEDEEENEEGEEKENNPTEVGEKREETRVESVPESQEDAEGGQSETYVVLSSPETKDEQLEKNPFFSQEETATAKKPCRKNIPWDTSDETQILRPAEQEEEEAQNREGFEENEMVCPETQLSENSTPELMMTSPASPAQPQSRADSEVMEVEEGGDAPAAEEEMMEQESEAEEAPPPPLPHGQSVECPMCSKLFPLSKIEVHAAYCDGEADHQEEQSQVVARRKRTRRNVTEETSQSGKSTLMEKCCIGQGLFSPQEYPEHVELCYKKRNSKTNQKNGLLSALERPEQRHAGSDEPGPSDVSTQSNCGFADPVATESVDCSAMSSCPSSTFTPQSENTACLTDSSKNSQRLSRKRKFKR